MAARQYWMILEILAACLLMLGTSAIARLIERQRDVLNYISR
jgi:hypothetical protein